MGEHTGVSWAHHSLNLWIGCQNVSEGCLNCYAERMQRIWKQATWGPETAGGTRTRTTADHWDKLLKWNDKAGDAGERRRVFINNQSDFFEDWPSNVGRVGRQFTTLGLDDLRRDAFELFDQCYNLDILLVTKRPQNARRMTPVHAPLQLDGTRLERPRNNVWLLTSVEHQAAADERIPELLKCRDMFGVLGISAEPLLEPIRIDEIIVPHEDGQAVICPLSGDWGADSPPPVTGTLDWVICGGESGADAKRREMPLQAMESLYEQCQAAGVPFFCKQDSGRKDGQQGRIPDHIWHTKQFPNVRTREQGEIK